MTAMETFEMRFSGTGGQGLQLSAKIISAALNQEGRKVAFSQAYEPTSRGGISRSDMVVSSGEVGYPLVTALDYLIVLDQSAAQLSLPLMKADGHVIVDKRRVPEPPEGHFTVHNLDLSQTALSLGNERVTNIVTLGALIGIGGICKPETLKEAVSANVPARFRDLNLDAVERGLALISGGSLAGAA